MKQDHFGDRMKEYEGIESARRFMPLVPIMARMDGRAFHSFTKGLQRPFDEKFAWCMSLTLLRLMKKTEATVGYTQSDEISLCWNQTDYKSQTWFDRRVQKMTSQLGAITTLLFYRTLQKYLPDYCDKFPTFDARVWTVPNLAEASNVFRWREYDATKNSVSMLAQAHFSDKELFKKDTHDKLQMLEEKGVVWGDLPSVFKRGVYCLRTTEVRAFTETELDRLPPNHEARKDPRLTYERKGVSLRELPPVTKILNYQDVLFEAQDPILPG